MDSLDIKRKPFIDQLQPGMIEEGYFLLKKIHLNIGKKNKPFLRIILSDKTGYLPAVYFDSLKNLQKIQDECKEGDIVNISGILEEYNEILQIKLIKISRENRKDWELSVFSKRTPHDRRELLKELKIYLNKINNTDLKKLCLSFLNDKEFLKTFLDSPASRFYHYAYIGGLLEHTLNVVKLVDSYSRIYPQADKNLLLTGAFLHDFGKLDEYEYIQYNIEYSRDSRLKGRTLLGYERVKPFIDKYIKEPTIKIKLEHIMISNKGQKRWGAISEPKFLEAFLIHSADLTDTSQFIFSESRKDFKAKPGTGSEYAGNYISIMDKEIYIG